MTSNELPPVTCEQLKTWLDDMPLAMRKKKVARMAKALKVSKRTIENWKSGRTIKDKHFPVLRDFLAGKDKVEMYIDPQLYDLFESKARKNGFGNDVEGYLAQLAQIIAAIALLAVVGFQAFTPGLDQMRKFASRRRQEHGVVELMGDACES